MRDVRDGPRAVADAWERFWFQPEPASTMAVFRIAFGALLVLWGLSLAPDLLTFFGEDGVIAEAPDRDWYVGLLNSFPSDAMVIAVWTGLMLSAVCLMVGFHSRLAAVIAFVAVVSLHRRTFFVFNGGDRAIMNLAFYLMLAPSGVALSLDRWRRQRDRFWEMPMVAQWPIRLIQIQVSLIYLFTVWHKVQGDRWNDGTALWYAWGIGDLERFGPPSFIAENLFVVNLVTFGTLAVELALAILVWNRRLRPWVLAAGVALHLGIDITMTIGFFSAVMVVSYIAFVPPESMNHAIEHVRERLARASGSRLRRFATAGGPLPKGGRPAKRSRRRQSAGARR